MRQLRRYSAKNKMEEITKKKNHYNHLWFCPFCKSSAPLIKSELYIEGTGEATCPNCKKIIKFYELKRKYVGGK
jgi:rubrerythrin